MNTTCINALIELGTTNAFCERMDRLSQQLIVTLIYFCCMVMLIFVLTFFIIMYKYANQRTIVATECCICYKELKFPHTLSCGHQLDNECLQKLRQHHYPCPLCRTPL
jgi:hypothetical protein